MKLKHANLISKPLLLDLDTVLFFPRKISQEQLIEAILQLTKPRFIPKTDNKSELIDFYLWLEEKSIEQQELKSFKKALDRAIEIELKSLEDDDWYRHFTPDPDLSQLILDHDLERGEMTKIKRLKRLLLLSTIRRSPHRKTLLQEFGTDLLLN